MSLMKTLAKVAIGVAVAKGANSMLNRSQQQSAEPGDMDRRGRGNGGLLGQLGGALGGSAGGAAAGGGLGGMLGQVLSGRQGAPGGAGGGGLQGGLGGLLDQLGGGMQSGRSGGGLGGLGGLLGGGAAGGALGGGLGGMLGQLAQNAQRKSDNPEGSFGDVLNSSFDPDSRDMEATPEQEATAGLMLRAMVQSMKADGEIDERERERLLGQLEGSDPSEQAFVREEMQRSVDPEGLARDVPRGLEQQIYAVSLMAIDLDHRAEAEYLHRLAEAMNLTRDHVNAIHEKLGVPSLYRS